MNTLIISSLFLACGAKSPPESNVTPIETPSPVQEVPEVESTPNTDKEVEPVLGSLDKADIDAAIKTAMPSIQTCYKNALSNNPDLAGKLQIKMVIGNDGSVSSTEAKEEQTTLNSPEVSQCVSAEIMNIVFPEPKGGGIVIVSYPFIFESE